MPEFVVILYNFQETPPVAGLPQTVEAAGPLDAAQSLLDEPLQRDGHITNLAAEVRQFEGNQLKQRVMLFRAPRRAGARRPG